MDPTTFTTPAAGRLVTTVSGAAAFVPSPLPPELELSWKQSGPAFAEMANPGSTFSGEIHWRDDGAWRNLCKACNQHAGEMIKAHKVYAERAGLAELLEGLSGLEARIAESGGSRRRADPARPPIPLFERY